MATIDRRTPPQITKGPRRADRTRVASSATIRSMTASADYSRGSSRRAQLRRAGSVLVTVATLGLAALGGLAIAPGAQGPALAAAPQQQPQQVQTASARPASAAGEMVLAIADR